MFYILTLTILGETLSVPTAGETECHNIALAVVEGYRKEGVDVEYTCEPEND